MILICTPARDVVQATFAYDLAELMRRNPMATFAISQGCIISNNRAALIEQALKNPEVTHILFIDSDMRFPPNMPGDLIRRDLPIVGANCRQRTQDAWTASKGGSFVSSEGKTGIEEVDAIGFGVTMIKTQVFQQLDRPWFATPYDGTKLVGEDVFFCTRAREAGIKIYVDHDLSPSIKHTGAVEL